MTAPHPALRALVARRPVGAVVGVDAFLASTYEHRLVGEVLLAVDDGRLELPADAQTRLGIWELREGREHLRLWSTIAEVGAALAEVGAEAAVIKGVATEARWYDHLGQRVATDVDLFLDPAARDRLPAIIGRLDPSYRPVTAATEAVRRGILHHVDLRVGDVAVDLHLDPCKVGVPLRRVGELWAGTEELVTEHGTIRVLSPEAELVLLLLHLNKDRFSLLGPFLDVGRLLAGAELDWRLVVDLVAADGLEVPVWRSLATVVEVLALDQVDVPRVQGVRARSWDRLWGPAHQLGGDEGRAAAPGPQTVLALHLRGRPREAIGDLRRRLLPPRSLLEVAGRLAPGDPYLAHLAGAVVERLPRPRRRGGAGSRSG